MVPKATFACGLSQPLCLREGLVALDETASPSSPVSLSFPLGRIRQSVHITAA